MLQPRMVSSGNEDVRLAVLTEHVMKMNHILWVAECQREPACRRLELCWEGQAVARAWIRLEENREGRCTPARHHFHINLPTSTYRQEHPCQSIRKTKAL